MNVQSVPPASPTSNMQQLSDDLSAGECNSAPNAAGLAANQGSWTHYYGCLTTCGVDDPIFLCMHCQSMKPVTAEKLVQTCGHKFGN